MSRKEELEKLIVINERRLQILREQYAVFGKHRVPPDVLIQIEDTEAEIKGLQTELDNLPASRVLFLDDLPDWRSMVGGLLRDYGYDAVIVGSVSEARQIFRKNPSFDLAIVDVRLDNSMEMDESGIDFACSLRDQGFNNLPIILLTAYKPKQVTLEKIEHPPYEFTLLDKGNIGQNSLKGLMYQITQIVPPLSNIPVSD